MNYKLKIKTVFSPFRFPIVGLAFILVIFSSSAFAQKKETEEDGKSKKTTVVAGAKYYLHTVAKGQTLFAIAKIYGRTVNDIVIENPEAIDGIKPGDILKVPFDKQKPKKAVAKPKEKDTTDSSKFIFHKVEKGQTIYSITKQYKIAEDVFKKLNPEVIDGLKIGQVVKIPMEKPAKEKETALQPVNDKKEKTTKEIKTEKPVKEEKRAEGIKTEPIAKPEGPLNDPSKEPAPAKEKEANAKMVYASKTKSEYNVAYFLPFHADEATALDMEKLLNNDIQLPNKSSVALEFYEGALIAIDSLKKQKLNAKIYVYDIDDRDSMNIENILKKPELTSMDLMIGPLYGSSFIPVSKFAKQHAIPIVSPYIQLNKILFNNPYVCKVSPSSALQAEQLARYAVDSFATQNIILVENTNPREVSIFNAFKNTINEELKKAAHPLSDTVKIVKGLGGVDAVLNTSKTNVVVYLSNNQSMVTEFVRGLNNRHEKNKIVVCGLQSWVGFDNLDLEYLNNLSLHFAANTYIDYKNEATGMFIKKYREQYKTEPEMYSYQGFDISYYFLSNLQKLGTGFMNDLSETGYKGMEADFNFKQFPSDSGFENKFVHILKFQDYKLMKVN